MGLASVLSFAAEGAQVVIADFNTETGNAAVETALQQGLDVSFIQTDVASEEGIEAMCEHALSAYGRLDVLFNNAGVGGAIGPITETTIEDWDYTFDVLAKGVFLGIKHGAKIMRRQGDGGSIINTASIAGLSGDAGPLVYSAAKAAVINLSKSAAVELAPDHIRVNAICPGFIATPLTEGRNPEAIKRSFAQSQPWPDHGRGEHIAGVALFLASDDAGFVTGESIVVDEAQRQKVLDVLADFHRWRPVIHGTPALRRAQQAPTTRCANAIPARAMPEVLSNRACGVSNKRGE